MHGKQITIQSSAYCIRETKKRNAQTEGERQTETDREGKIITEVQNRLNKIFQSIQIKSLLIKIYLTHSNTK